MKAIRVTNKVYDELKKIREYSDEPLWRVVERLIEQTESFLRQKRRKKSESTNTDLWHTWSEAYRQRYGVDYPRNAKVNSQLKQLRSALGDDAEEVIRFYLMSNDAWVLKTKHALGNLVKSPESWHVRWQSGQHTISDKLAKEAEKAATAQDEIDIAYKKVERLFSLFESENNSGDK